MKSKLISLLFLLSVVTAQYPGFKSTISQNGLTYGAQVGVELLEKGITTLQIPTQTGTVGKLRSSSDFRILIFFQILVL